MVAKIVNREANYSTINSYISPVEDSKVYRHKFEEISYITESPAVNAITDCTSQQQSNSQSLPNR